MTTLTKKILSQGAGKVLDVCDAELSDILRTNLTQANIEVISARKGAEALKKARAEKPDIILLDTTLPDIDGIEFSRQLKDSPVTCQIPVIIIGTEAPPKGRATRPDTGMDGYIAKPFEPKEVVSLVLTYLKKKKREENIDPLTGLPNLLQVSIEIGSLIHQEKTFAVLYLDIDNLKVFNRAYGFDHGDQAIRLLADIATEAVQRSGSTEDLVAHLGGDNFLIITTVRKSRTICRRTIAEFDRRKKMLFNHDDLARGYIEYESALGVKEQSPIMNLRAAVVTNEKSVYHHYLQVIDAAAEQLEYLSRFPGVTCFYDLRESGMEPGAGGLPEAVSREKYEEIKALQGALAWFASITNEIKGPARDIGEYLKDLRTGPAGSGAIETTVAAGIKEKLERLTDVADVLENLVVDCPMVNTVPDELNLKKLLGWIIEQVSGLAGRRKITVEMKGVAGNERIFLDGRTLAQGLLYLVRAEIGAGAAGDSIHLGVSARNDEFVTLQIKSTRYIPARTLHRLLQDHTGGAPLGALRNNLYPARLLIQGLGGKLAVTSEKTEGTVYNVIVPRRWQSWMPEVNALLFATDISRKQARAEIRNIHSIVSSLLGEIPPDFENSVVELRHRVQELGILCNRSLYLAEDFHSRLETQQDRWLQQEIDQVATLESILTISGEMARLILTHTNIFNAESARRVARNTQIIAGEMKLNENERQAIRYASLLKDLGLVLSARDLVERNVVPTIEEATKVRDHFNPVWKALATVPFFNNALSLILYRFERFDGTGGRFGVSSSRIPLGARILAVADTFEAMITGAATGEKLTPQLAVEKIAGDSGTSFDPDVVSAFMLAWKSQELVSAA
ncbi:MAG: hypothetical protein A2Z29_02865 [Chloroflexi bacterium RBG_16_56_11]|nr:MAG: hypothetical protein A2Z29_02865 [Chloroflexi bacterium RBG_16_56_11]